MRSADLSSCRKLTEHGGSPFQRDLGYTSHTFFIGCFRLQIALARHIENLSAELFYPFAYHRPAEVVFGGHLLEVKRLNLMAVSPGVVTGPVKVLRNPHDKTVEKGDVLVAYTTDPGWTPLFVNASAVVLEVGGILQHGAVIAREYGKPCVAGVDRVVSKLRDGQRVEVDGTAGVIRLLG